MIGKKRISKSTYQIRVIEYKRRRTVYKEKFGLRSKKYIKHSIVLNRKISSWTRAIKRIEARDKKIYDLDSFIYEFYGVSVFNSRYSKNDTVKLAKNIFIKYGMEMGIQGIYLGEYIGLRGGWTASKIRMKFTKSFQTSPQNKEDFHKFKNYINEAA